MFDEIYLSIANARINSNNKITGFHNIILQVHHTYTLSVDLHKLCQCRMKV